MTSFHLQSVRPLVWKRPAHTQRSNSTHLRQFAGKQKYSFCCRASAGGVLQNPVPLVPLVKQPTLKDVNHLDILEVSVTYDNPDVSHPVFHDEFYKARKAFITKLAREHQLGLPIPRIDYTETETATWAAVLRELSSMYPELACAEYLRCFGRFGFRADSVPQLQELSDVLMEGTGWQVLPVAGLLNPREFFRGLACRTFHSCQYMRHPSNPLYSPEIDVCHELLGHVPMLADPDYCDLLYTIGLASLEADKAQLWHLVKIYWYTIEFGVIREGNGVRAFGAGILGGLGEMKNLASGRAELLPFDPFAAQPKMKHTGGYQDRYFVVESFADAADKLRAYIATMHG